jgi:uncharacterized OsmC-like protein
MYNPDNDRWLRRKTLTAHNPGNMRTVVDTGEFGELILDEPANHGGSGDGPSPLQTVLGALCGCEAVTFRRTATEMDLNYESINFDAAFTIDVRGRLGDRSVRPHFQTVRVRAIVATDSSLEALTAVIAETEARCPVMNLLLDAKVDLEISWVRESAEGLMPIPREVASGQ